MSGTSKRPDNCTSNSPITSSLGEEQQGHFPSRMWKTEFVDGSDHPFAIFTFKYCSKSMGLSLPSV